MKTVIEMARESHLDVYGFGKNNKMFVEVLGRFADLVRADEREDCAKVCETKGAIKYAGLTIGEQCAAAIRAKGNP